MSTIFLAVILLACTVNLGCSVTLELYSGQHYSGLVKKITLEEYDELSCIKLDQTYQVRSLKTDKCVIAYETGNCNRIHAKAPAASAMYSVRVEGNTALFNITGAYSKRKEERGVQSFHLCGTDLGGGLKLNVDIYSDPSYSGDLVASYRNVCECKNIPSYILLNGKYISIDNHGNNMKFYDKEDCTGLERFIPAGDNERSRCVFHRDAHAVVIRSFRPADTLSCQLNLDASIYKFTFVNGLDTRGITEDVLKSGFTVRNTGHTTEVNELSTNVPTTLEYSVAKAFTFTHATRVKTGFLMEFQDAVTQMLGASLVDSFNAHYQYTSDTYQNTPAIVTLPSEIQATVQTPPCTKCTVDFAVTRVQGFPINYTAEAIVTGVAGNAKASAQQIRHFLPPGMKYVRDFDEYSVVVAVQAEMKGGYGKYSSETSCQPVPNC